MKAILIDPFVTREGEDGRLTIAPLCCVREVEIDGADPKAIYDALSHDLHPVSCFDLVRLPDGDAIFVDDDGLLCPRDHWFLWKGYPQPLAGRGLILGSDAEGETTPPKITLAEVKQHVLTGFKNVQTSPEREISILPTTFPRHYMHGWRDDAA